MALKYCPEILIIVVLFSCLACERNSEQFFKNLAFSNTCVTSTSGFCDWDISYQVRSEIKPFTEDESSNVFLRIENSDGVGFVEQEYVLTSPMETETIFTFSADIKSKEIIGKGAGLNISVYDEQSNILQSISMGYADYSNIKGSTNWNTYTINTVLPKETASIKIGCINYGKGIADFDNISVNLSSIDGNKLSKYTKEYISTVIDSVRKHSLRKDSLDFALIKNKAFRIAGNAKEPKDVYLAIRYILNAMEDHHSFFMTSKEYKLWSGAEVPENEKLAIKFSYSKVIENIGYINVPGFHSDIRESKQLFTDTIKNQLKKLYTRAIKGWIVDLRDNDGGNMNPMLAGLEPLFSADTLGSLVDVNKISEFWGRGEAYKELGGTDYIVSTIDFETDRQLPIAILYDGSTGSSGEIIIISFIGNAMTKSFGQPSYGLTTGNSTFELPDGSYMFLASTNMADRNGKVYTGKVIPDVIIEEESEDIDKTIEGAIYWINSKL